MYAVDNSESTLLYHSGDSSSYPLYRRARNDGQQLDYSRQRQFQLNRQQQFSGSQKNLNKCDFGEHPIYESAYLNRFSLNGHVYGKGILQNNSNLMHNINGFNPKVTSRIIDYSSGVNPNGYVSHGVPYGIARNRAFENQRYLNTNTHASPNHVGGFRDFGHPKVSTVAQNSNYHNINPIRRNYIDNNIGRYEKSLKSTDGSPHINMTPYVGSFSNELKERKSQQWLNGPDQFVDSFIDTARNTWRRNSPNIFTKRYYRKLNDSTSNPVADCDYTSRIHNQFEDDRSKKARSSKSPKFHEPSITCNQGRLTPMFALELFGRQLTKYERKEILEYPEIYFLGLNAKKRHPIENEDSPNIPGTLAMTSELLQSTCNLNGFDDAQSSFILVMNDQIAYRYEIIKHLGKGSFGQVVLARDHCTNKDVAIKIIRNEEKFTRQAQEEIRILKLLNEQDVENSHNVIRLFDNFVFRKHVCMVFELLHINLYELLHRNEFRGLSQGTVSKITRGILDCLVLLYDNQIIHCDLKPENILLRRGGLSAIKVIDFGSSCFAEKRVYTYIQSRYYRAPEVMLGMQYGTPIDIWSLGCIVAELITGLPLFPGEDEDDQIACIMEHLGLPPASMKFTSRKSSKYFTKDGEPRYLIEQQLNGNEITEKDFPDVNGNGNTDKKKHTTSSRSSTSAGMTSKKEKQHSRHWKPRGAPGSTDLTLTLTTPKRSSVYASSTDNIEGSQWSKVPGSRAEPIDPDMVDFISGCLRWCPKERMVPTKALQHPWITKNSVTYQSNLKRPTSMSGYDRKIRNINPLPYQVPDGVEATEELLQGMQAVRLRNPGIGISMEARRSQIAGKNGHVPPRSHKRYSTGHETIRHLLGSDDFRRSSSFDLTKIGLNNENNYVSNNPEQCEYREFLNAHVTDDLVESIDQSASSGRESIEYERHRPRRAAGRRLSSVLRTNDVRTRRNSGLNDTTT